MALIVRRSNRKEDNVEEISLTNEIKDMLKISNLLRSKWFWFVIISAIAYGYIFFVYGRYWATIALNAFVVIAGGLFILFVLEPTGGPPQKKKQNMKKQKLEKDIFLQKVDNNTNL